MNELSGTELAFEISAERDTLGVFFDNLNSKFFTIFMKSTTDVKFRKFPSLRGKILAI